MGTISGWIIVYFLPLGACLEPMEGSLQGGSFQVRFNLEPMNLVSKCIVSWNYNGTYFNLQRQSREIAVEYIVVSISFNLLINNSTGVSQTGDEVFVTQSLALGWKHCQLT